MDQKSRNWVLTIFNFDLIPNLKHESIRYSAYGDEICKKTGRPHKQAFVVFKDNVRFSHVKKLFPSTHIEKMQGRLEHNEAYCSKEGSYHEYGNKPMTKRRQGELGREYWQEQLDLARQDPDLCDPKLQITHLNNLERIHERAQKKSKLEHLTELDNWWFVGPTGTGKSRTARELYPDAYIKQCNKWWNDYEGQETVIIEDINPDHKYMANFIDQWCDHYPFPAETKGGQKQIRPKRFIITSRYNINEILIDPSQISSWERRFKIKTF